IPGHSWHSLPEFIFEGATTTAGILIIKSAREARAARDRPVQSRVTGRVRQGVATGADHVFHEIALMDPGTGMVARAVRGRDIARGVKVKELPLIWVPVGPRNTELSRIMHDLDEAQLARLRTRYCFRKQARSVLEYHEGVPDWFMGSPKLIVPEICKRLSVLED